MTSPGELIRELIEAMLEWHVYSLDPDAAGAGLAERGEVVERLVAEINARIEPRRRPRR